MEIIISLALLIGTFLIIVASLGILRLPDLYIRMHAATKGGTVGLGLLLLAVALFFQDGTVTSRVIGTVLFVLLTAPVAAHLLGKAMLQRGYQIWRQNNTN